jgi:UDP-glucose 4-epimerase
MRLQGERVLVTGGLGFIGRHLCRALAANGASVVALDREGAEDFGGEGRVEMIRGDLRTADLGPPLRGCGAVFHLAASADVRAAEDRPREVFEDNVLATARLLDAMHDAGVTRLGFTSTSTVYGEAAVIPTPEDHEPLAPISVYGASKLAAEGLVQGYAANRELTAVVWRFANVVGGGATHGVVPDFVRKLRASPSDLEILGADPGTRKSYVHIDDIVEGMLRSWSVVDRGVETFNLGSEDAITVREVADAVCGAIGLAGVRYRWTGGVDGGGWKGDVRTMALAVDKLRARGWRPRHGSAGSISLAAKALAANR